MKSRPQLDKKVRKEGSHVEATSLGPSTGSRWYTDGLHSRCKSLRARRQIRYTDWLDRLPH